MYRFILEASWIKLQFQIQLILFNFLRSLPNIYFLPFNFKQFFAFPPKQYVLLSFIITLVTQIQIEDNIFIHKPQWEKKSSAIVNYFHKRSNYISTNPQKSIYIPSQLEIYSTENETFFLNTSKRQMIKLPNYVVFS